MIEIIEAVSLLNEEKVIKLVKEQITNGTDPLEIFKWLQEGMDKIGQLYETSEYFISDLIMAGIIFREVIELVDEYSKDKDILEKKDKALGTIVLGTVRGDLHDIGKDIFSGLLLAEGFEVFDLGVDVSPETFVEKVKEIKPDIIGLSGVLTMSLDSMKEVVDKLEEIKLRDNIKIIIGGNSVSLEACKYLGVDIATKDAIEGVEICKSWVERKKQSNEKTFTYRN